MRLSEIKWQTQNKDTERSQILFKPGASTFYILMRSPMPGESAKPPALRTRYSYMLYRDGYEIAEQGTDPEPILDKLWPTRMTPLELKCWEMENGK